MGVSQFAQACYRLLTEIPRGQVTTYRELALAMNSKGYRAIGQVLNKNPDAPEVPCHRVVCHNGKIGGYADGVARKKQLLEEEGLIIEGDKIVDFQEKLYRFTTRKIASR